jgi:hypothetical protein
MEFSSAQQPKMPLIGFLASNPARAKYQPNPSNSEKNLIITNNLVPLN